MFVGENTFEHNLRQPFVLNLGYWDLFDIWFLVLGIYYFQRLNYNFDILFNFLMFLWSATLEVASAIPTMRTNLFFGQPDSFNQIFQALIF